MQESDDHIGDLHAGVVDVVLHIHFSAGETQQADEGIAQDGIAQVADVRRLVGIDAGVLDQNFAARHFDFGLSIGGQSGGQGRTIDPGIDIARAGEFEFLEAFDRTESGDDFLRDFARGLAELLGEFKSQGQRVLSEFDFGGLLDDDLGQSRP